MQTFLCGGLAMHNYDRRASTEESLSDRMHVFFEETVSELQKLWRSPDPRFKVEDKKLGLTYICKLMVDASFDLFDRKVTFEIDGGHIRFTIEQFKDRKMDRIGTGSGGIDSTPNSLAQLVDRAITSSDLENMYG